MKVTIAIFAVAAILATTGVMTTTMQQASADRVGPNCPCPPGNEDQLTQGGLGEFFSKQGRDTYFGGVSGHEFGQDQISQVLTLKSSEQIPHSTVAESATQTESRKHANRC